MKHKLKNNITATEVEKLANKCLHCGSLPIAHYCKKCGWNFDCKCGISTRSFDTPEKLLSAWNSVFFVINYN